MSGPSPPPGQPVILTNRSEVRASRPRAPSTPPAIIDLPRQPPPPKRPCASHPSTEHAVTPAAWHRPKRFSGLSRCLLYPPGQPARQPGKSFLAYDQPTDIVRKCRGTRPTGTPRDPIGRLCFRTISRWPSLPAPVAPSCSVRRNPARRRRPALAFSSHAGGVETNIIPLYPAIAPLRSVGGFASLQAIAANPTPIGGKCQRCPLAVGPGHEAASPPQFTRFVFRSRFTAPSALSLSPSRSRHAGGPDAVPSKDYSRGPPRLNGSFS